MVDAGVINMSSLAATLLTCEPPNFFKGDGLLLTVDIKCALTSVQQFGGVTCALSLTFIGVGVVPQSATTLRSQFSLSTMGVPGVRPCRQAWEQAFLPTGPCH